MSQLDPYEVFARILEGAEERLAAAEAEARAELARAPKPKKRKTTKGGRTNNASRSEEPGR